MSTAAIAFDIDSHHDLWSGVFKSVESRDYWICSRIRKLKPYMYVSYTNMKFCIYK